LRSGFPSKVVCVVPANIAVVVVVFDRRVAGSYFSIVERYNIAGAVAPVPSFVKANVGNTSTVIREFELMKLLKASRRIIAVENSMSFGVTIFPVIGTPNCAPEYTMLL